MKPDEAVFLRSVAKLSYPKWTTPYEGDREQAGKKLETAASLEHRRRSGDVDPPRSEDAKVWPLDVRGDIPMKRAVYLLEKWSRKGWYEYGVAVHLGWITDPGREKAATL